LLLQSHVPLLQGSYGKGCVVVVMIPVSYLDCTGFEYGPGKRQIWQAFVDFLTSSQMLVQYLYVLPTPRPFYSETLTDLR
jgi:hypothetical protein